MNAGVFIMIDGIDGSGKKTQADKLVARLKESGYAVEMADFPQYGQKSAGPVEDYLNGVYGTSAEVGPYRASILFAVDRYAASHKIRSWLQEGKIVVTNRYVSANMGHQGSQIIDPVARTSYFTWLKELEYGLFQIPVPDIHILLHISPTTAQHLVDQKAKRAYLGGEKKRDILEDDLNHLKRAEETYQEISRLFPGYTTIECEEDGALLDIDTIHNKIWSIVQEKMNGQSSV